VEQQRREKRPMQGILGKLERTMADFYLSMTALYADPLNVEGTTYGKRWKRHEWSQTVETQSTDNPETQKVITAIHGGGIEGGTRARL